MLIAGYINIHAPPRWSQLKKMTYTQLAMMSKKGRLEKAG
jgi:hypothetical protein